MADIARRRAAHFANYRNEEEEEGGDPNAAPHVGGSTARTLGPWSSAVELANAREAALNARQVKLQGAADRRRQVVWTPRHDVRLGPRPRCNVPLLFDLALDLVVEYAEDVESLWGLPEVVRTRVAAAVCRARRLSPSVARLFVTHAPEEVCLPDCALLGPAELEELLVEAATPRLERLELGMCGRGMSDATARALATAGAGCYPVLTSLRLGGAYRLSDGALAALLPCAPALASLALPQCSRLEGAAIEALPRLAPQLRELDLTECAGLSCATLLAALSGLKQLEGLVLDGVVEADDALLAQLPEGTPLRRLSLAHCAVTDAGVAALAAALPGLLELRMDDCAKVGPPALAALAAGCRGLHTLSLRRCVKVTDAALSQVAELGTLRCLSLSGIRQLDGSCLEVLAQCCAGQLERLDVSWCREIPEQQLGRLVDACPNLAVLELWGCSHVTETFLHGHGSDVLQVVGRGEALLPVPVV